MINKIKNIIIAGLFLATLFQINTLWFSNGQSLSFFGFFEGQNQSEMTEEAKQAFIKPFRIAVGHGAFEFSVHFGGLSGIDEKHNIDRAVSQAASGGEFVQSGAIVWNELLSQKCVIYDYAVSLPFGSYAEALGGASNLALSKIKTFDCVVLLPKFDSASISCYFVNKTDGSYSEFSVKADLNFWDNLNKKSGLKYIFPQDAGGGLFEGFLLVPDIEGSFSYPLIDKTNPYVVGGSVLINTTEKYVDAFFENPAAKWRSGVAPYTFSDDTTVVKYHSNDVLEYSSYKASEKKPEDLLTAYSMAFDVMNRDTTIANEIYLAELTYADGNYYFGFDYVLDNFPVSLSGEKSKLTGMNHLIEINILSSNVTKYKRYVSSYEISETEEKTTDLPYDEFLVLAGGYDGDELPVSGLSLRYLVGEEQTLNLYWVLKGFTRAADL